ncbi:unnamed protein product, partial [marine sediment metagenome]
DEMGINLLDEVDVQKQAEEEFESPEEHLGEGKAVAEVRRKEDELLEKKLKGEDIERRIDDPIRMYLTQMGCSSVTWVWGWIQSLVCPI